MPSLFSSILKAVNRDINGNEPMDILCINQNEAFQFDLAKTGHNFYYIQPQKTRLWDTNIRPKPSNCYFLKGVDLKDQLKQDMQFDLILCQNKFTQFGLLMEISKQISCPIILMENNLSDHKIDPYVIEAANNQEYNHYVFNSNFLANSCGLDKEDDDVSVIDFGIDIGDFGDWNGKYDTVCGVVKDDKDLDHITGLNIFGEMVGDFQVDVARPTDNNKNIVSMYKTCGVFLNTSQWIINPRHLLEAMATGCPVVTTDTANISSIVEHGVNGYVTNDINDMKTYLKTILEDREVAKKLGNAARETIANKFCMSQFLNKWNKLFTNCVGKTSTAFKGNRNVTIEY